MKLIAIAIVAANRVIGDGQDQPFKFKEDFARFKKLTFGHPVIMGRKTFQAMGQLSGRFSIVITKNPQEIEFKLDENGQITGVGVTNIEDALSQAQSRDDLAWVIGGGQIYSQFMPLVDQLELTQVHREAIGQVKFPPLGSQWQEVARDPRDEFDFVTYRRRES